MHLSKASHGGISSSLHMAHSSLLQATYIPGPVISACTSLFSLEHEADNNINKICMTLIFLINKEGLHFLHKPLISLDTLEHDEQTYRIFIGPPYCSSK